MFVPDGDKLACCLCNKATAMPKEYNFTKLKGQVFQEKQQKVSKNGKYVNHQCRKEGAASAADQSDATNQQIPAGSNSQWECD